MKKRSGRIITLLAALGTAASLSTSAFAGEPATKIDMILRAAQQDYYSGNKYIRILSPSDGDVFYQGKAISYNLNVIGSFSNYTTRPYVTLVLENKADPNKNWHIYDYTFPQELAEGKGAAFKGKIETDRLSPGTYLFGVMNWPCKDGKKLTEQEIEANRVETPLLAIEIEVRAHSTHSWNAGEITKPATVTEAGEKTYTCTLCEQTRTEVIPATGYAIKKAPASVKGKSTEKGKVTFSWKGIKNTKKNKKLLKQIKSIEVQYSTDPKFTENCKVKRVGKKKTSVTLKLKRKTTYYFHVRYIGNGGTSKWSKTKSVKIK